MFLQPLETRRLFHGSIDSNGLLQVEGTAASESIFVTLVSPTQIDVTTEITQSFNAAQVTGVRVSAGDGNDIVVISGLIINVAVDGGGGNDRIVGGPGKDKLFGDGGNDSVYARDKAKDTIRCGPGKDTVEADKIDAVARDCEKISRK